jgi:nucleoside-diphosphate-sugar epimerase
MDRPIVLLTGAGGQIGAGFRDAYIALYQDAYALRLSVRGSDFNDSRFSDLVQADVTDLGQMERACAGVDTVVHLAASADWEGNFCDELVRPNIIGAYHVFEAARRAGCRRVVYASSVHAIMGYPVDYQAHSGDPARPDTMYGVTKVFGESLCSSFHYLYGMSCIAVRIGAYVPDSQQQERVAKNANPQMLDIMVSERDMTQLIHRCITADARIGYAIINGLSDNRFKRMDIERARKLLGYEPDDDAFVLTECVEFGPEEKV